MNIRLFRKDRLLSGTVIAITAVGVAATTNAFALLSASLFRAPPFRTPERVTIIYSTHTPFGMSRQNARWSYPRIQLLKRLSNALEDLSNYTGAELTLTGSGDAEPVRGEFVSPTYFRALGVGAVLGRTIASNEDDAPGAHPIVVLGHELWVRRYGSDSGIVGRTIGVNRVQVTVVGVMPAGFRGLTDKAQLWLPTTMAPSLAYSDYLVTDQNFISAVGRLRTGVTLRQANAELQTLGPRVYASIPDTEADSSDKPSALAIPLNAARVHATVRQAVLIFVWAVALLHLLACANLVSLLLGRAISRHREAAVRAALGSTPRALFAVFFREDVAVVGMGGLVGVAIACLTVGHLGTPADVWGPANFYGSLGAFATPSLDWSVVLFGMSLAVATAILVAWAPAARAQRVDVREGLREGPRGTSQATASLRRPSARGLIVASETALAVMLLVAGGLMIDSFRRMRETDLGVEPDHVLTFSISPSESRPLPSGPAGFVRQMLDAITAVPGVVSASVDGGAPLSGTARSTLYIAGRPAPAPQLAPPVLRHYVAPDHFRTLGIPLIRGRIFSDRDVAGQPRVAIISETAARLFWPNEDPIGQRVWFGGGSSFSSPDSSAEIVGIVADVMYEPLDIGPNRSSFYTPFAQFTYAWRIYFVRASGDPSKLGRSIRQAVKDVDPDVAVNEMRTLRDLIGASWSRQRFDALFFGGFALLALGLAVSGIYAVVAHAVKQRTREMGIRLALGSRPGDVLRLVVREGMVFPLVGLALGVVGARAVGGVLRSSLYGITPGDPAVTIGVLGILAGAALVACIIPARRATRVDPCVALREE